MVDIKEIVKEDFQNIEENEPISKAISKMKKTDGLVVLKDGRYVGIVKKNDVLRTKISPETKVRTFLKNVAEVTPDFDFEKTAALMLESNSYILPVFGKDKIIGVVTADDLLKRAVETEFGEEPIKRYISRPVVKISSDESISNAIKLFKEEQISRLPVYDNDKLTGIITLEDAISKVIQPQHRQGGSGQYQDTSKYGAYMADKKDFTELPVSGFMSEKVFMMSEEESVKNVVNRISQGHYRGMIIGKENKVSGIVTKKDLLEPLATMTVLDPIVIQFSGELDKINDFQKKMPKDVIHNNFDKHLDYLNNAHIYVRLKRHTEQSKGKHIIYCKMRLSSPRGMFIASEEGWGYMDAINKSCEAIEKQIRRKKGDKK